MISRLLLVDADCGRLRATEQVLVSAGHLVICASTFDQARRCLLTEPPDLLVTHVRLGAYNGLHLVIHGRADHPSLPAIVIDVARDPVLETEAKRAGAVYVADPLTETSLVALVRQLEKDGGRSDLQRAAP